MKRFAWILVLVAMLATLTACGNDSESSGKRKKGTGISASAEKMAEECLTGMFNAKNEQEIVRYLDADCQEHAAEMLDDTPGKPCKIEAHYLGSFKQYDVFEYTATVKESNEEWINAAIMLARQGDHYLVCGNPNAQQELLDKHLCGNCDGTRQVSTGNRSTCPTCGGVGTQYIPNAYYDSALNMWMGQTITCAGCGGSGFFGSESTMTCGVCNGKGLIF